MIGFWLNGRYDASIDVISKSFQLGGFSDLLIDDLRRLKCFFAEVGGVILDSNDSALADFLSFQVPVFPEEHFSDITLEDSECIPFR